MHYVDDPQALAEACAACAAAPIVGLDTEFERSVTYHPRPALLQLTDGHDTWLVDPLALPDLAPVGALIAAGNPLPVLHSALEDLTVLARATGREPARLFDTQLAAAFAGVGFGLGYHALVKALLGIAVSKGQTRSDWLRRPLSDAQKAYAAADVAHLPALHGLLDERLRALGRCDWLDEETARMRERAAADDGTRDWLQLARRVSGDDAARGRLRELCLWREQEARDRDRPRRHVAGDELLVAVALVPPADRAALESMEAWREGRARAGARALLGAVQAAAQAPPQPLPPEAMDLTPHRETLQCLRRVVSETARSLGLEPALLAPRRMLESAVVHTRVHGRDGLPEDFGGWRDPLLRERLMACLHHG